MTDTDVLLLTVPEVCERLHLSRPVVYELINSGKLRSFKVGKARRIPARALGDYIAQALGETGDDSNTA
jgi:excisionase family DNA binding protein